MNTQNIDVHTARRLPLSDGRVYSKAAGTDRLHKKKGITFFHSISHHKYIQQGSRITLLFWQCPKAMHWKCHRPRVPAKKIFLMIDEVLHKKLLKNGIFAFFRKIIRTINRINA